MPRKKVSKLKFKPWGLTDSELAGVLDELAKDPEADIDKAEKVIFAATKKAFERAHGIAQADTFEGPAS